MIRCVCAAILAIAVSQAAAQEPRSGQPAIADCVAVTDAAEKQRCVERVWGPQPGPRYHGVWDFLFGGVAVSAPPLPPLPPPPVVVVAHPPACPIACVKAPPRVKPVVRVIKSSLRVKPKAKKTRVAKVIQPASKRTGIVCDGRLGWRVLPASCRAR